MCWILFQQGTLVEELCHQLRYLPMLKKWAEKARLRLLCEGRGKDGSTSTVIVSVVSVTVVTEGFYEFSLSFVCFSHNFFFGTLVRRKRFIFLSFSQKQQCLDIVTVSCRPALRERK